jgi:DNA invertase Pin-like site-specific DNA recombinase
VGWGILSTANINAKLLAGLRGAAGAEPVAVASRERARAEDFARAHGIARAHGDYESLLADPDVTTVVVEHKDRLGRMNVELVEAALAAHGRRLVVLDDGEVDNDLVRDMVEILTSFCARLYGRRSAKNRAKAALEAAAHG